MSLFDPNQGQNAINERLAQDRASEISRLADEHARHSHDGAGPKRPSFFRRALRRIRGGSA